MTNMRYQAVGRIEYEIVPDDQCEERVSDQGNAADEFEADYEHWLRVRQETPRARAAGMVGASAYRKDRVEAALRDAHGHRAEAAALLRTSLRNLASLIRTYQIDLSLYPQESLPRRSDKDYSKKEIVDALQSTRGNQGQAAQQLGTTTAHVLQLIRRYHIDVGAFLEWQPESPLLLSREEIEEALRETKGNQGQAARNLGIDPNFLLQQIEEHEIDVGSFLAWPPSLPEAEEEPEEPEEPWGRGTSRYYAKAEVEEALRQTKGNQGQAARKLKTTPTHVLQLIQRYGIDITALLERPPSEVGRLSPEDEAMVTEAIDRAYTWWFDTIGAIDPKRLAAFSLRKIPPPGTTKAAKEARRQYMQNLSIIREIPRELGVPVLSIIEGWYASATLQRECRRLFGHGPGFLNFLTTAENATIPEWNYWTRWYHHAHQDVQALSLKHRIALDQVAAIIAVTSPGNQWPVNLAIADYILSGIKTKKDIKGSWKGTSTFPRNGAKVEQILMQASSDPVKGPKVEAFYLQLIDPETNQNFATVDGHMINLWLGLDQPLKYAPHLTSGDDRELRSDMDAAAKEVGIHTQELQALVWYVWRYSINKEIIPASTLAAAQALVRERLEEKGDATLFRKKRERTSLQQFLSEYAKGTYPMVEAMLDELDEEIKDIDTGEVGAVRYLPVWRPKERR